MLKANELRLYNLVECFGSIDYVKCVNEQRVGHISLGQFSSIEFDLINPIPLTEDWLLKFGFGNHRDDFVYKGLRFSRHEDSNDPCIKIACGGLWIGLDYVHELQNLVQVLLNEELTIKETANA
jgi:hypothetical protein